MLLPDSLRHLLNRHVFRLRQQEHDEERHDENPTGEEEEDPELEVAKHRQKSLRYDEGEEHVHTDRDALPGRPGLQGEDLRWHEPPQRAPRPGERRHEGADHDDHEHREAAAHVVGVVAELEAEDDGDHCLGHEHLDARLQEEGAPAYLVDGVDRDDGGEDVDGSGDDSGVEGGVAAEPQGVEEDWRVEHYGVYSCALLEHLYVEH